jgi:hypothetical protein
MVSSNRNKITKLSLVHFKELLSYRNHITLFIENFLLKHDVIISKKEKNPYTSDESKERRMLLQECASEDTIS